MVITRSQLSELNALVHEEATLRAKRASMAGHLEWVTNDEQRRKAVANIATMDGKLRGLRQRMMEAGLEVCDGSSA